MSPRATARSRTSLATAAAWYSFVAMPLIDASYSCAKRGM
jgi:hypothetical protein